MGWYWIVEERLGQILVDFVVVGDGERLLVSILERIGVLDVDN